MTKEAGNALKKVSEYLREKGYLIKIFDAYRPQKAVDYFVSWAKNNDTKMKKYFYPNISKKEIIPKEYVYNRVYGYAKKSSDHTPNRVRVLLFPSFGKLYLRTNPLTTRYCMPKKWFLERDEYEFEGLKLWGTKDYDAFLKYMYDDYMTLPPENEREPHAPVSDYEF